MGGSQASQAPIPADEARLDSCSNGTKVSVLPRLTKVSLLGDWLIETATPQSWFWPPCMLHSLLQPDGRVVW